MAATFEKSLGNVWGWDPTFAPKGQPVPQGFLFDGQTFARHVNPQNHHGIADMQRPLFKGATTPCNEPLDHSQVQIPWTTHILLIHSLL